MITMVDNGDDDDGDDGDDDDEDADDDNDDNAPWPLAWRLPPSRACSSQF